MKDALHRTSSSNVKFQIMQTTKRVKKQANQPRYPTFFNLDKVVEFSFKTNLDANDIPALLD